MKFVAVGVLAFGVGLVGGLQFAARQAVDQLHQQVRSDATLQRTLAFVSVHALDELQEQHVDEAKAFLAKQAALYYHTPQELDPSPEKNELINHIEKSSRTCPELQTALEKKP